MTTSITYTRTERLTIDESKINIDLVTIDDTNRPAKNFNLILDTGAFITLIRKDRAQKNGYKIEKERACRIAGFSEKGLLCDLRRIPTAVFCGFRLDDIIVATPHDDGIEVSEVLGMNIIENFNLGLDLDEEQIYLNVRHNFVSQKPRYQCGKVSVINENEL
ncbi:MAG: retropepsin-like domain-containing protein [Oscillospiraceae bacterium]|nr:retropepsin-like domain-containing protein [Oscillospiraceae bacterium]